MEKEERKRAKAFPTKAGEGEKNTKGGRGGTERADPQKLKLSSCVGRGGGADSLRCTFWASFFLSPLLFCGGRYWAEEERRWGERGERGEREKQVAAAEFSDGGGALPLSCVPFTYIHTHGEVGGLEAKKKTAYDSFCLSFTSLPTPLFYFSPPVCVRASSGSAKSWELRRKKGKRGLRGIFRSSEGAAAFSSSLVSSMTPPPPVVLFFPSRGIDFDRVLL